MKDISKKIYRGVRFFVGVGVIFIPKKSKGGGMVVGYGVWVAGGVMLYDKVMNDINAVERSE